MLKGDLEGAERNAKQGLDQLVGYPADRPDNAAKLNLLVLLAQIALSRESWDEASDLFSQAYGLGVKKAEVEEMWLAVLLRKGSYSKAKTLSAEILKRDPSHNFALLGQQLQLESPNVEPDGTYVSTKFRIKSPKGWIVWDSRTNAHGFNQNVANPSLTPVYFTENPLPNTAAITLSLEPLSVRVSAQEAMARLRSSIAAEMARVPRESGLKTEGPKEIQLNGKLFFWYRWDQINPGTGAASANVYWIFFAGDLLYTFSASGSPEQYDHFFPIAEEVAGSLEVTR